MSNDRNTLERELERLSPSRIPFERLARLRDRKRRNQRIRAGVVGIAVFLVAVWVVTSGLPFHHTGTPAAPASPTEPTETGSTATPTETGPTAPWSTDPLGAGTNEVVAYFDVYHKFVFVYADGRALWHVFPDTFVTERRLTPEGVDLVRSGALQPDDFLDCRGVVCEVPTSAWADAEAKEYVPTRYAVCYYQEDPQGNPENGGYEYPSTVLGFFPAPARAILRGELTHGEVGDSFSPNIPECSEVTIEEAHTLDGILRDVRVEDSEGNEIYWETDMLLPHGGRASCLTCG